MRELGEGIPRMFEIMEKEGLKPPEFRMEAGAIFVVALHNTVVYSPQTLKWLQQFDAYDLSSNQKRLLAYAQSHRGQFTSRAYQKLVGVVIYTASRDIKDLVRKGIVQLIQKGGRIYKVVEPSARDAIPMPEDLEKLLPILHSNGYIRNRDVRRVHGLSRMQAYRLLEQWVASGFLQKKGRGRGSQYVLTKNVTP